MMTNTMSIRRTTSLFRSCMDRTTETRLLMNCSKERKFPKYDMHRASVASACTAALFSSAA